MSKDIKQKNIVSYPDDKMNDMCIAFNLDGKQISFNILTNVKDDEMYPVLDNWLARTNKYTDKSLVDYINSKSKYGFKAKLTKVK